MDHEEAQEVEEEEEEKKEEKKEVEEGKSSGIHAEQSAEQVNYTITIAAVGSCNLLLQE